HSGLRDNHLDLNLGLHVGRDLFTTADSNAIEQAAGVGNFPSLGANVERIPNYDVPSRKQLADLSRLLGIDEIRIIEALLCEQFVALRPGYELESSTLLNCVLERGGCYIGSPTQIRRAGTDDHDARLTRFVRRLLPLPALGGAP